MLFVVIEAYHALSKKFSDLLIHGTFHEFVQLRIPDFKDLKMLLSGAF